MKHLDVLIGAAAAIVLAQHTAAPASAAAALAPGDGQVENQPRFLVNEPDVVGGYASTHVIVKVRPEVRPRRLEDGRATFASMAVRERGGAAAPARPAIGLAGPGAGRRPAHADEPGQLAAIDALDLADTLQDARAGKIELAYPQAFGDPQLATALGLDRYYYVSVPVGTGTMKFAAELGKFDEVFEEAIVDGVGGSSDTFPDDVNFNLLWGMHNAGQSAGCAGVGTLDSDIDAPQAWDIHTGTDSITIAVVDSGVNPHPDIAAKMVPGWNSTNNTNDTSDGCDHGTHVAGTAAATGDNAIGVAGVSWGAKIMPVRVLSGCSGSETWCANGIIWAADNGADVATMSLQYYTGTSYFRDAVAYAHGRGTLLIAATGNNQGQIVAFPARFDHCMAVGATDNRDARAWFSNYGPEIDVAAPGEDVFSLLAAGGYGCKSGTSMATPHVSGLACLIWSFAPHLDNDDVAQILMDTTEDLGTVGWDEFYGHGRVNAHAAMLIAGQSATEYTPSQFTIRNGAVTGGTLESMRFSDDERLVVQQRAPFTVISPSIDIEIETRSLMATTSELKFTLEAASNAIPSIVPQRIELYVYGAGGPESGWEIVDERLATMSDNVVEIFLLDDPTQYIEPQTGRMRARLRWFDPRTLFFPAWSAKIDHVMWTLTP